MRESGKLYTVEEIKKLVRPILLGTPVKKAFLFGSYARGDATESSDVDIIIDSDGLLRGFNFFKVADEIEDIFNGNADVFEVYYLSKKAEFYDSIIQKGVVGIYERQ